MQNSNDIKIFTFDASSHLHRAYENCLKKGFDQLETAYYNGTPRYLIKPFYNLINQELQSYHDDYTHIIFVFDNDDRTNNFRYDIYNKYKNNRKPKDSDFIYQKEIIKQLLEYNGYCVITADYCEADDIIATINKTTTKNNISHTIFTKDKDLFALVNKSTKIFYGGKNHKVYNYENVIEDKGVNPELIFDYLTLVGDVADNIKGVEGIGDKTAIKILKKHTLNEILTNPELINNIDKVRGKEKIINYINNNIDFIHKMNSLILLKDDIQLNKKLSDFKKKIGNQEAYNHTLSGLGLN
tara:strand:+ start:13025 stop:13918 length:894 start_codon:yes stop_codon:yes gene_type:complete